MKKLNIWDKKYNNTIMEKRIFNIENRFETREEAEQHMDLIKVNHTTVYPFHKIVEIK